MSDYDVGYGRPPKNSQFKKGESGNPTGRPKKSKNLKTILLNALQEEVIIKEGNQKKVVTKSEALIKSVLNKALSGDVRSMKWVAEKTMDIQGDETDDRPLSESDEKILELFLQGKTGNVA